MMAGRSSAIARGVSSRQTSRRTQSASGPSNPVTNTPCRRSPPAGGSASSPSSASRIDAASSAITTPRNGLSGLASVTRPTAGISTLTTSACPAR